MLDIKEFYTDEQWNKFLQGSKQYQTPCVLINLDIIKSKYLELTSSFPKAKIYYAVKSNPADQVINLLNSLGSCFDVASRYELDKLLRLNVDPKKISYGNTIKKVDDIKYFYQNGVTMFATDSDFDLENISKYAKGSRVFCRILVDGCETADWPLSRKFGCHPDMAIDLLYKAKQLGLKPIGVSFHVGSQQRDIGAWDSAIAKVNYIFQYLKNQHNINLSLINMGGGFPANYISKTNNIHTYTTEINRYLNDTFGENNCPDIIFEPGRSLVAESGILVSSIILISQKTNTSVDKWVYIDAGKFNGLVETWDESIKYPLYAPDSFGEDCEDFIIAGPTCDSQDVMYETYRNPLPNNIKPGDKIYWLTCGAYTSSYASVEFNGFPPIKTYFV